MPTPELATTLVATDDDLLLAAEARVRAYCGWHIAPVRQATVVLPWHNVGQSFVLPTLHLVAVTSVVDSQGNVVDPADLTYDTAGLLSVRPDSTGWWWRDSHYTITRDPLPAQLRSFTVTFTHGYAQVPADVAAAVRTLATLAKANPNGLSSQARGPFVEQYASAHVQATLATVDRYRLPARP